MTEKELYNQQRTPSQAQQTGANPYDTRSLGQTGGDSAQPVAEQARQAVSEVAGKAGETVGQLKDQAREKVVSQVETGKQRASETLTSVASALRQTGDQLRGDEQGMIADYASQAADQLERFSGFLRDRDLNEIVHEAERFARRQPALFLGGAFVLGLLGARFIKSSSPPPASRGYGGPRAYSYPPAPRTSLIGQGPNYNPSNRPLNNQSYGGQGSGFSPASGSPANSSYGGQTPTNQSYGGQGSGYSSGGQTPTNQSYGGQGYRQGTDEEDR